MSPLHRHRLRTLVLVTSLLFAMTRLGQALYIEAKAQLAQYLLQQSWQQVLADQQQHKPWPWADTWPSARLRVPRLGEDLIVLAGANGRNLAFAPGHLLASASPGSSGTVVVGGHRDTHFGFLKRLQVGDDLHLQSPLGEWRSYRVSTTAVADTRRDTLQLTAAADQLLLVTCYPFDAIEVGGPLRYVVTAEAVAPAPTQADLWARHDSPLFGFTLPF